LAIGSRYDYRGLPPGQSGQEVLRGFCFRTNGRSIALSSLFQPDGRSFPNHRTSLSFGDLARFVLLQSFSKGSPRRTGHVEHESSLTAFCHCDVETWPRLRLETLAKMTFASLPLLQPPNLRKSASYLSRGFDGGIDTRRIRKLNAAARQGVSFNALSSFRAVPKLPS
jgi:hypothetical protein